MAVTIKQVASAAGVSVSTVSRAFTAPDQVQPQTLQRVREAAAALGYSPTPPPVRCAAAGRARSG
ncbi:LacI family DNA-binding transcriptional regulator [Nonomuraea antimicrobica]